MNTSATGRCIRWHSFCVVAKEFADQLWPEFINLRKNA
jgi:hypothetical protein